MWESIICPSGQQICCCYLNNLHPRAERGQEDCEDTRVGVSSYSKTCCLSSPQWHHIAVLPSSYWGHCYVCYFTKKMQFWVSRPWAFTPTLVELNKSRQPSEEISKQTRSDRLWRKLIFSDTWQWDPLTSTQHNRRAANGEREAKASDKETRSESMIRPESQITPEMSLTMSQTRTNRKKVLPCPFSL